MLNRYSIMVGGGPKEDDTFGGYIRCLRSTKSWSQRELARRVGISAPYLNDIEKGKRSAPQKGLLNIFCRVLEAEPDKLFDLAGLSRDAIPADIEEMIRNSPETVDLLRAIQDYKLTETDLREFREVLWLRKQAH